MNHQKSNLKKINLHKMNKWQFSYHFLPYPKNNFVNGLTKTNRLTNHSDLSRQEKPSMPTESEPMADVNQANFISSLSKRMKALAAKTVENGCSEQEALAAFEMLSKMQEKYNLSLNEATLRAEGGAYIVYNGQYNEASLMAISGIKELTNTAYVVDVDNKAVLFFGTAHDCEYASYLFAIVNSSLGRSYNNFIPSKEYAVLRKKKITEAHIRYSFYIGVAERLCYRLLEMAKGINNTLSTTGKEIVVIKETINKQMMERLGIKTQSVSKDLSFNALAHDKGMEAGGKIPLAKGVKADDKTPLLLEG